MTPTEKLLKRLPKKYHKIIRGLVAESNLIDDCKYMLYFWDGVTLYGEKNPYSWPVRSINEAVQTVKDGCTID